MKKSETTSSLAPRRQETAKSALGRNYSFLCDVRVHAAFHGARQPSSATLLARRSAAPPARNSCATAAPRPTRSRHTLACPARSPAVARSPVHRARSQRQRRARPARDAPPPALLASAARCARSPGRRRVPRSPAPQLPTLALLAACLPTATAPPLPALAPLATHSPLPALDLLCELNAFSCDLRRAWSEGPREACG